MTDRSGFGFVGTKASRRWPERIRSKYRTAAWLSGAIDAERSGRASSAPTKSATPNSTTYGRLETSRLGVRGTGRSIGFVRVGDVGRQRGRASRDRAVSAPRSLVTRIQAVVTTIEVIAITATMRRARPGSPTSPGPSPLLLGSPPVAGVGVAA